MKHGMRRLVPLVCAVLLQSTLMARAQENINPRAKEDLKAFVQKVEEGDALFKQKKYAESAAALASANESYQRAERRDDNIRGAEIIIKPQTFPAMRYYGYIAGPEGSFKGEMEETLKENYVRLHSAAVLMWRDATILSDAKEGPLAYAISDPPLEEITEERLLSAADELYSPIRRAELPVPDREWRDIVLMGRRAQLIMEHLLEKYPAWRTNEINWINQPTGDAVLADIKKKLDEAEPEYKKLVTDFTNAEPAGVSQAISEEVAALNKAIAGVKRNGWIDWTLARDIYISKDYLADRRKRVAYLYTAETKTMPADKLKPIENKIAELKSTIDKNAPRWSFPANKPHNAALEARAKSAIKARFPGTTIIKMALGGTDWTIQKNEYGLPRYRTRDVLALLKMPGQKWAWLVDGEFYQTYAGGGTYNSGGNYDMSNSAVRLQAAR